MKHKLGFVALCGFLSILNDGCTPLYSSAGSESKTVVEPALLMDLPIDVK